MRVLSVTLLSFLATIFFGAGLLLGLPGDFAERALWVTVLVPIIWASFMIYSYWDKKPGRTVLTLTGISLCSLGVVLTTPIPA